MLAEGAIAWRTIILVLAFIDFRTPSNRRFRWPSVDNITSGLKLFISVISLGAAYLTLLHIKSIIGMSDGIIFKYGPSLFTKTSLISNFSISKFAANVAITRSAPPPLSEGTNNIIFLFKLIILAYVIDFFFWTRVIVMFQRITRTLPA